ncbi:MAG: putative entry exclusion protein TrbK-alt [Rhizobium sp.]
MDLKIAVRMIAVLALGSAMIAAVMVLRENAPEVAPAHPLRDPGGEPAHSELARCRDIGTAALEDASCRKAWAENRRRFLGTDRPSAPSPERSGSSSPRATDSDGAPRP